MKYINSAFLVVLLSGVLAGCSHTENKPDMANPASVFCEEQGGQLEMREDAEGNISGYCHFNNGSVCEEWAFFRGQCYPEKK